MGTDAFWAVFDLVSGGVLTLGVAVSVLFSLVACASAWDFRRPRPRAVTAGNLPGVSVLKPLAGSDPYLYDNLASLCRQDYPRFQIICGVRDPHDAAIAVVQRLRREYPACHIDLVIDGRLHGTNRKVSNLLNMYCMARHEVLVIADSDVRVCPGYLRHLVTALADPSVGVVSCLYRSRNNATVSAWIESLCINTDFVPMVLVARVVERPRYAFGATMALRRSVLDECSGFLPLADVLADDYQLGQRVAARGYRLVLSDLVVDTAFAVDSWRQMLTHQLRWARTYRACRPLGYFFSILGHGTLWAILALSSSSVGTATGVLAATSLALRGVAAVYVARRALGIRLRAIDIGLLPFKDLGTSFLWLLAFAGNTVVWRGARFRLRPGGRIDPVLVSDGSAVTAPPQHDRADSRAASA